MKECNTQSDSYESAPRGQNVKEILWVHLSRSEDPRASNSVCFWSVSLASRYMVAELLYGIFLGVIRHRMDFKLFWILAKHISDDGVTANSAYGARLFRSRMIRLLKEDLNQLELRFERSCVERP